MISSSPLCLQLSAMLIDHLPHTSPPPSSPLPFWQPGSPAAVYTNYFRLFCDSRLAMAFTVRCPLSRVVLVVSNGLTSTPLAARQGLTSSYGDRRSGPLHQNHLPLQILCNPPIPPHHLSYPSQASNASIAKNPCRCHAFRVHHARASG